MKKTIITLLFIMILFVTTGCTESQKSNLDTNINDDINTVLESKIAVSNLVPSTLKLENSNEVASLSITPTYLSQSIILADTAVYEKDELESVQSEGFKIIDDHIDGIQENVDKVYDLLERYLNNIDKVGLEIKHNNIAYIFNTTDSGYTFYLVNQSFNNPHYLELTIDILEDESVSIKARYEIEGVSTSYIEFTENYIKEIHLVNDLMFRVGEFTVDEEGNSTIKHYRKNLVLNRDFYLIATGNDTYGGLTRYHYDDFLKKDSQYTEVYNSNAELIFQSYRLDSQVANLGVSGARWFLNNVDGWKSITDEQGDGTYTHNWTIVAEDDSTVEMNNGLFNNILTRGYNIAYEPFKRVSRANDQLEVEESHVLVLLMVEDWLDTDFYTLPEPFSATTGLDVKAHVESLENIYSTEELIGIKFNDVKYDEAVLLIPERNIEAYPTLDSTI